jgi:hypothetical protein
MLLKSKFRIIKLKHSFYFRHVESSNGQIIMIVDLDFKESYVAFLTQIKYLGMTQIRHHYILATLVNIYKSEAFPTLNSRIVHCPRPFSNKKIFKFVSWKKCMP